MKDFKDKSIILAVPNHFGLPKVFKKNLEYLGFKVFTVEHDCSQVKLSAEESLIHIYKKAFSNNRTFKAKMLAEKKEQPQLFFLDKISHADYALVVRPDLFSKNVLAKIQKKSTYTVAYQWDGMQRFPLAEDTIQYFDSFFVFDERDTIRYPQTKHIHNFYFDYLPEKSEIKQDLFFVGTFMKDRIEELCNLSILFQEKNLKTNINVIYTKEKHIRKYQEYPINFTRTGMSFEENMKNAKSSRIILDFQNTIHKGLSFRVFEAVGYRKKLITNNELVKEYSFYNSSNIFLLNDHNMSDITHFLADDYIGSSDEIYQRYSFSNWIQILFSQINK
ncbi:hypothetical protein MP477_08270 [Chryseobacterium sp. WG23]|uniref:hypothetical protein n=1 Tax=Chryseobacterium sp. WG23 TaxID=2926910 RepID=UPI00211E3A84|nr:hypothetical protein [Chryseobacterium sp. WG23]MCQ9634943.1 hypothetical protein [Chryseobacterium sp. WG23]